MLGDEMRWAENLSKYSLFSTDTHAYHFTLAIHILYSSPFIFFTISFKQWGKKSPFCLPTVDLSLMRHFTFFKAPWSAALSACTRRNHTWHRLHFYFLLLALLRQPSWTRRNAQSLTDTIPNKCIQFQEFSCFPISRCTWARAGWRLCDS